MTDTFTPQPAPASPEEGLLRMRVPFPPNQVSLLPKNVRKAVQGEEKWACKPGSKASVDGRYCGGFHAASIHLDYVGHAAMTDRLLDADPAWNWEPLAFTSDGFPRFDADGGLWIKLTVQGVTRLGYGDAQGKKGPNATKEVIGDALRNAGLRFGGALDLWHKGDLHDANDERGNGAAPEQQDRDWYAEAKELKTFGEVRLFWQTARDGGATVDVLDRIVELGNELAEAEKKRGVAE